MKRSVFIILALVVTVYMAGCGKKQKSLEEMQEPMSMEAMSTLKTDNKAAPAATPQAQEPQAQNQASASSMTPSQPAPSAQLEPLPPSGPYKPSAMEIQTALKNAGFYSGTVDGKAGPKTKKAIEAFQQANGLKADGKVGPRTWAALSKHLNAPVPSVGSTPSN